MKKLINSMKQHKDLIQKILLVILLTVATFSSFQTQCTRRQLENLSNKLNDVKEQNSQLQKGIEQEEARYHTLEQEKEKLSVLLAERAKKLEQEQQRYRILERRYNELEARVLQVPVEDSYQFLIQRAYPFQGEKRYPFNEPQVKGIHLTWLQNAGLQEQNTSLLKQIEQMDGVLEVSEKTVQTLTAQVQSVKGANDRYQEMMRNEEEARRALQKNLDRTLRRNRMLKVGVYGGSAAGLLLGILIAK